MQQLLVNSAPVKLVLADLNVQLIQPDPLYFGSAIALLQHPDLMRWITTGPRTKAAAESEIIDYLQHWRQHNFGNYFIIDLLYDELVGFGKTYKSQRTDDVNIGYLINTPYQGRGLGTKIAQTLQDIGFTHLNQSRLDAFARVSNHASRRILEKTGFICLTDNYWEADRQYAHYQIDRTKYLSIRSHQN